MMIARWLFLFAGLAACVSVALYLLTRNPLYWRLATRIITVTAGVAVVFFIGLMVERLLFS